MNPDLLTPLDSETFRNVAARGAASFGATGTTGTVSEITATISFNIANNSYTLTTPTGTISFGPGDIDNAQSSAGAVVYVKTAGNTTNSLTLTRPGTSGPITYTYVGSAFWQKTVVGQGTGRSTRSSMAYPRPMQPFHAQVRPTMTSTW